MTITPKQLREAARLIHQMLRDAEEAWIQQHLLVWRSAK